MQDSPSLSSCVISDSIAIRRQSPRPLDLRNEKYEAQFDWKTVFYDVYRSGGHTVFQGPPLFNLRPSLTANPFFQQATLIERPEGFELWFEKSLDSYDFTTSFGQFQGMVQSDECEMFNGKRVLVTVSKDNNLEWIKDWLNYHIEVHNADALLLYDNASSLYSSKAVQIALSTAFPSVTVHVVDWPFRFGAQGGVSGGVGGKPAPWDSSYCQSGALQHARFRYLQKARSVLICDIDELVLIESGTWTAFEAAESALFGIIHFSGKWISIMTSSKSDGVPRHKDYFHFEKNDKVPCPTKWSTVPRKCPIRRSWGIHEINFRLGFLTRTKRFSYRHFKAITTNWKYNRNVLGNDESIAMYQVDTHLKQALETVFVSRANDKAEESSSPDAGYEER